MKKERIYLSESERERERERESGHARASAAKGAPLALCRARGSTGPARTDVGPVHLAEELVALLDQEPLDPGLDVAAVVRGRRRRISLDAKIDNSLAIV